MSERGISTPSSSIPAAPNSGSVLVSMTACSIENSWNISPNTGSIRMSDTIQNRDIMRVDADARDMRYSGRNKGSDCQFGSPFLGSRGCGVHTDRKYRFKWLFLNNIDFNHDLSLQFSGLRGVTLFCHRFQVKKVIKG